MTISSSHRIQRPTVADTSHQSIKVRFNPSINSWEVWTHRAGTNLAVWRWFQISKSDAEWYMAEFFARVVPFDPTDISTSSTSNTQSTSKEKQI